jgi:trans-aconitate methyltransferase
MINDWQRVWDSRSLNDTISSVQAQLLEADGFASSFSGSLDLDAYQLHIENMSSKLLIKDKDSIFEVGCGCGAFLYPFYQAGHNVAGLDYSESLIEIASNVMPQANLEVGEAIDISGNSQFDIVVSNSVFFYFPDYLYASKVLAKMLAMANKSVGVFDVPDLAKRERDIARRQAEIGEVEYAKRYKNLDHLYYSKDWFLENATRSGFRVEIEDQTWENYGNSDVRFNALMSECKVKH